MAKIIGVLGGTFNPIHNGHIGIATAAHEQYAIPRILVMPSGDPSSYKNDIDIVNAKHRCNMVSLAVRNYDYLELSDIEVMRKGKTYTADTLVQLKRTYDYIYFIMGADSLFSIENWYKPDFVMKNCHILVADRAYDNASCDSSYEAIGNRIEYLKKKYGAAIDIIKLPKLPYSSTDIRLLLKDKRFRAKGNADNPLLNGMLDDLVYEYITDRDLYL